VDSGCERPDTPSVFDSRLKALIESKYHGLLGTPRRAERDLGSSFPLVLTEDEDIEVIRALVHAGQAKAVMQVVMDHRGSMPQPGLVVTELTPSGWLALKALLGKGKP